MRLRNLPALLLLAVPTALSAQGMPWVGRWVNINLADEGMPILAFTPDGRVHRLMFPPKHDATYRLEGSRVVTRNGDSVDSSFVLRADTIWMENPDGFFIRLPGNGAAGSGVRGTWMFPLRGEMDMFFTFRSDSVLVLEVGLSMEASRQADTLRLVSSQSLTEVFTVRQAGDTLHLRYAGGRESRYVRRPWGCTGLPAYDARASECR